MRRRKLNIPIFTAASSDDATVDSAATVEFMAQTLHPCSMLVLYTTDTTNPPAGIPAKRLELVNGAVPEQKILSSAHTAIVLPPDDAHYGTAGEYANCIHYYPHHMDKYAACISRPNEAWQGEVTEENLEVGTLRRLMVNPHFAALERSIGRFTDNLP